VGQHVLVLAKAPIAGQVKTRLCPPCTPEEARLVAEAALADTLEAVAECGASRRVLALDGPPGPWLPTGFDVIPQRGATFAERLANSWADAGGAGIQIGMDTPQVGASQLDHLLAILDGPANRALLGRAEDGGWWVIGWARPMGDPGRVFRDIPLSTPHTGARQARRLSRLGFDVVEASRERDIDTAEDLAAIAVAAPTTRTAAVARRIGLAADVA
jgi:glycosyltransferase A (GT-A) superfamily protein (DUF2064 family)